MKIKFSQVKDLVEPTSGIYEIFTNEGIALKVGIAKDLKKRLTDHGKSKQSRIKIKDATQAMEPHNVISKKSILAKHLYFDRNISKNYDLTTELGRQAFLEHECYVVVTRTSTREEARVLEIKLEKVRIHRYLGLVIWR